MNEQDARWIQRFENYQKALANLKQAVEWATERDLSGLEKDGVIRIFEFTYELAWKTLKDILEHQGYKIIGPRDAIKIAFNRDIIENGQIWMDMIVSRNETVRIYNHSIAEKIYRQIMDAYYGEFIALEKTMLARAGA